MSLEVLISAEQIASRVKELAAQIDQDLAGESVVLLGVLKGSIHFLSDLSRAISTESQIDFVQVSSYEGTTSTGQVRFKRDHDISIDGRHVIVVEDILDTGLTLQHVLRHLQVRNPKSLRVASLLRKPEAQRHEARVDYLGFDIANEFVVGYGLDYDERHRSLPFVAVLHG